MSEEEIVNSEDIQFYEYLGLLEQAYYDTHVGSKAGTIIIETIKSYVNILKYKNNKLQQKVEEKDKEIDRLNNIINELEKWLTNEIKKSDLKGCSFEQTYITGKWNAYSKTLDKLKELKENK